MSIRYKEMLRPASVFDRPKSGEDLTEGNSEFSLIDDARRQSEAGHRARLYAEQEQEAENLAFSAATVRCINDAIVEFWLTGLSIPLTAGIKTRKDGVVDAQNPHCREEATPAIATYHRVIARGTTDPEQIADMVAEAYGLPEGGRVCKVFEVVKNRINDI